MGLLSLRAFWAPALAGIVVAGGFACSNDDDDPGMTAAPEATSTTSGASPAPTEHDGRATVNSGAATLRAGLTALLQEHVYLAGIATGSALGGDTPGFEAAAAQLDENSQDLAAAIGSVYGDAAGQSFLELWRTHIGFFVDYTTGKATGDQAMVDAAILALDGYRQDFGAFLAAANPNLPKDAVAEELKPHVATLFAAIDAQAAGDPTAYEKLREAASHMPHTAEVLAGAIVAQFPEMFAS